MQTAVILNQKDMDKLRRITKSLAELVARADGASSAPLAPPWLPKKRRARKADVAESQGTVSA